jgi:hypothetical protein
MVQGLRRRRLDGPPFPHTLLSLSLTGSNRLIQGGGILTAFTSFFPDLVDNKVLLIAPTGLVEVTSSVLYSPYRTQTRVQSKDLSKTTKFMSSPFVQSVTSSAPFRVRGFPVTCGSTPYRLKS